MRDGTRLKDGKGMGWKWNIMRGKGEMMMGGGRKREKREVMEGNEYKGTNKRRGRKKEWVDGRTFEERSERRE